MLLPWGATAAGVADPDDAHAGRHGISLPRRHPLLPPLSPPLNEGYEGSFSTVRKLNSGEPINPPERADSHDSVSPAWALRELFPQKVFLGRSIEVRKQKFR